MQPADKPSQGAQYWNKVQNLESKLSVVQWIPGSFNVVSFWDAYVAHTDDFAEVQQILGDHFAAIQASFSAERKAVVESLNEKIQNHYKDSDEKKEVLQKMNRLLQTRLPDNISPLEKKIDEIEQNLPPDTFPPFRRDERGNVIDPAGQLKEFQVFLSTLTGNLRTITQSIRENSRKEYPALPDISEKLSVQSSAKEYLEVASLLADTNFILFFHKADPDFREKLSTLATKTLQDVSKNASLMREWLADKDKHTHTIISALLIEGPMLIPPEIKYLLDAKTLLFKGQKLYFPQSLGRMALLNEVSFENCDLKEIPDFVFKMRTLTALSLHNVKIGGQPLEKVPRLPPQLVNLNISNNKIKILDVGYLNQLTQLTLTGNPIEFIDPSISNCVNLEQITCSRIQLFSLPVELANCPKLRWIGIKGIAFWEKTPTDKTLKDYLQPRKKKLF